ncbi:MAG: prolipoprotein diacylglyceryl transferase, partial [Silvanigrellaceae bacterium]|nr:prolipoprotein diacylglyceryl transferase [Silvanigrellaceae bacterium]
FWLIIGGFIGARAYHVLSSINYYIGSPVDIFKVWNGGLSIYGALIGGFVALWVYRKFLNLNFSFLSILDWVTHSIILGQNIGRFGNLFNYEAFGYPTGLPWKMFVPEHFRPNQYQNINFYHPFFLYEALGNLLILIFLVLWEKKNQKQDPSSSGVALSGRLFFFYVLLYNTLRFSLEFLRIDSTFINGIRLNVISSLVLVVVSAAFIFYNAKYRKVP